MKKYIEHFKNHFPKAIGDFNTEEKKRKRLYKILRKDIFEKEYNNTSNASVSNLQKGFYLVTVTKEGKSTTKKLIVN